MEFKDLPATAKEAAEHALRHCLQHADGATEEMAVKKAGFIRDAFVALYFGSGNKLEPEKASGKMTTVVAVSIPEQKQGSAPLSVSTDDDIKTKNYASKEELAELSMAISGGVLRLLAEKKITANTDNKKRILRISSDLLGL